jgi:uncharacterized tellurite resistance protein B-like protein
MPLPSVVDGTFGVRIDVPPGWEQVEDRTLAAVWRTKEGVLVLASHLPEQVIADPSMLDDYRMDLRLVAAAREGGLVACEPHPTLGIVGLTKEPSTGLPGIAVVGRALTPTSQGHLALSVVAQAGDDARARDAGLPPGAGADPYGFRFEPAATTDGFTPWSWPEGLMLAHERDGPEHDAAFPDHPLSRVREVMGHLRTATRRTEPAPVAPSRTVKLEQVAFDLPLGFLAAEQGRLRHGQLFRRVTFEKRVTFLTVCHHPEVADAGTSVEAARRLVDQHLAWAHARLLQGPRVATGPLVNKQGVIAEHEASIGAGASAHETYSTSFFLPWEGHTLEVTCFGEKDDWARARRVVDQVVGSLRSASRPALVPDTTRISGEVTPAGRRRVYRILCHLAHCDGAVDPKEREALEAQREQLLLDREEAEALEAEGQRAEKLDLSKNPAEQRLLLDAMIEVVAADGSLQHEEQRRIMEIAQLAGIPKQNVTERLLDLLTGG